MTELSVSDLADRFVMHSNKVAPSIVFERAQGVRLWDVNGKEYLDFVSSNHGPAMVGHSHPRVVEAIQKQAEQLISTAIIYDNLPLVQLCEKMSQITPEGLDKTYICPGGGEANEGAIKLAMHLTGRDEVVSVTGAYHGQSIGTMWLCGVPSLRDQVPTALRAPNQLQIIDGNPYRAWPHSGEIDWQSSLDDLEKLAIEKESIAAVIIEPIQGVAGHIQFGREYYERLGDICRTAGILLIADEIQTALGRCGSMWASDLVGLRPDIITTGKAFGGGLPYGAVTIRSDLVTAETEQTPWHMVSAQGNPLQAAAALAVIAIVEDEHLVERSQSLGELATKRFQEMAERYEVIGDVRGPGLFIGVELVEDRETKAPASEACDGAWLKALDDGLLTNFAGIDANTFKFAPPLTVSDDDFDLMLDRAEQVVADVDRRVRGRSRAAA
jgi:4-aminobutyrate aminotransferase-like enzyme